MYQKILEQLTAKFQGVRKDGLELLARSLALQVQDEEGIDALVSKLQAEQVATFVKDFRGSVDREITKASKSIEERYKAKPQEVDDPKQKGEATPSDKDELIKTLLGKIEKLEENFTSLKGADISKTRLATLNDKLKDCKDETYKAKTLRDFNRISFQDETEWEQFLKETSEDLELISKATKEREIQNGFTPPMFANASKGEPSEEDVNAIVDGLF